MKRIIQSYSGLSRVQIGYCFVRKDCIETVNEEEPGTLIFRTLSGSEYTVTNNKQAKKILKELQFNE
jgi:hypothetical protein